MGRRRSSSPLPPDAPSVCARIGHLVDAENGGSIKRAAKAWRVSHPALTRVIAGQPPSWKLIEAIADLGYVSLAWLILGIGEPVTNRNKSSQGICLPVVTDLLTTEPSKCPERLGHQTLPAASPYLIEDAYWYRAPWNAPIVADDSANVCAGDYLMIETSPRWTRRPEALPGRLVALRNRFDQSVLLARVSKDKDDYEKVLSYDLDTFGVCRPARLFPTMTAPSDIRGPSNKASTEFAGSFIGADVVGVVLQLARMFDRHVS